MSTDVTMLAVGQIGQVPSGTLSAPDLSNIGFLSLWHINLLLEEPDIPSPFFGWCLELCQLNYEIIQSCQLGSWKKCTPCKLWTSSIVPQKCPHHQHVMNASLWPNKCFHASLEKSWVWAVTCCELFQAFHVENSKKKNYILYIFVESRKK